MALLVKICGLRTVETALAAARSGADMLGFVFAPSRRRITQEQAATIIAELRHHGVGAEVKMVGLFVNEPPAVINAAIAHCNLDYVQLSGDERPEQAWGIDRPVIKSVRLSGDPSEQAWIDRAGSPTIEGGEPARSPALAPYPLIVDAHVPGSYGGSGTLADWDQAAALAKRLPLLLAGGLTPANVAAAIEHVRPRGVDVSSGVETNGVKDSSLIEAFLHMARSVV
ncbi:MAG: phosphoribosylanthranilate isomerase [Chloroflexaceae bacterium]|nr:phosphoribosylanthranilate isomerase [Chloroflexaceae bacterium]